MDEFDRYRAAMNEKLLGSDHLGIKRFFALDTQAYEDGALDKRTKELMGLVASLTTSSNAQRSALHARSFSMPSTWRSWLVVRSPFHTYDARSIVWTSCSIKR
jgi:hypothetical protein